MKRALGALSGLFYVADSEFEQFYNARAASLKKAEGSTASITNQEINLDTVTAYLKAKFPKLRQYGADETSKLVQEIKAAGYSSIDEVDRDINRAAKAFEAFSNDRPPDSAKIAAIGVARISLVLASKRYGEIYPTHGAKKFLHLVDPM